MRSLFLAAIALAATAVLASPSQDRHNDDKGSGAKTTVTVSVSVAENPQSTSSPATVKTYSSKAAKPTKVNVPLTTWIKNESTDLQWYTKISVGTPPQEFNVLIDTGSNILLLAQNNCTNCPARQKQFHPAKSSTFAWGTNKSALQTDEIWISTGSDGVPFAFDEQEGTYSNYAVDTVSIQGLTATNFTFLLTYNESSVVQNMPNIDGMLGLSLLAGPQRPSISDGGDGAAPPSLQYRLLEAGLLESGIFGMYLPSGQLHSGILTLGGVDETKFEGDLTWVPLDKPLVGTAAGQHTGWVVDMQTIFVNGKQLLLSSGPPSASRSTKTPYPKSIIQVLDSAFPTVVAPDAVAAGRIYAQISPKIYQIDPAGAWGCSCKDMAAIVTAGAEITFLLGFDNSGDQQLNITIPSSVFNLGPYPGLTGICQGPVNNWDNNFLPAGVAFPGTDAVGLWSLGSTVLKNYYTAWDGDRKRVGFAPLKGSRLSRSSSDSTKRHSLQHRHARAQVDERQLEPVNIGMGGALILED